MLTLNAHHGMGVFFLVNYDLVEKMSLMGMETEFCNKQKNLPLAEGRGNRRLAEYMGERGLVFRPTRVLTFLPKANS